MLFCDWKEILTHVLRCMFCEVHLGCDMSFLVLPFLLEKGKQKADSALKLHMLFWATSQAISTENFPLNPFIQAGTAEGGN